MFSVIFPGQGSQVVGMGKEFYQKFEFVKRLFSEADEVLDFPLSNIILEGPKDKLDLTTNTQPAIFLVSYSIFQVIIREFNVNINKAKFFAGHSLGEYTALACADYLDFQNTIKILRIRGKAMQNSVTDGDGGMIAVLGTNIENVENILIENEKNFKLEIANDNSDSQIILSGKSEDLEKISTYLKSKKIKNVKLPVSAPFHCSLMNRATDIMREELNKLRFNQGTNPLISNVTAKEILNIDEIKSLLIKQIENKVRWRESIINMIDNGVDQFIEIGPGKVLSGLVKRINKNVKISSINNEEDIKNINI